MLRKFKYFLLSFVFFISSLLPCVSVYAQGDTWTDSQKVQFFAEGFYKIVTDVCGLILPTGLGGQDLQNDYKTYVLDNDWIQNNMSYDEWVASQYNIVFKNGNSGDADVTISEDMQQSLINWGNYYIQNNTGFIYGYTSRAQDYLYNFNNKTDYDNFIEFVNNNDDSILFITEFNAYNNNGTYFYRPYIIVKITSDFDFVKNNTNTNNTRINTDIYTDWTLNSYTYQYYIYDFSSQSWGTYNRTRPSYKYLMKNPQPLSSIENYMSVSTEYRQYIVYNSLSALQSDDVGVKSYYVTDSYNTNNSVTGSYNTTTNDINNSITYGDVQNYVNNYYVENNEYPTSTIVYNYINNYVPPENGGGNGSDNGGGNSSNIFDFLGNIGDFLGNLIKGIGNVLSGILSAITDVIDMFIGENGLPNVIGELISYFLPFLPEWIPTVIGLSVMLALLIGIVKLIRGS